MPGFAATFPGGCSASQRVPAWTLWSPDRVGPLVPGGRSPIAPLFAPARIAAVALAVALALALASAGAGERTPGSVPRGRRRAAVPAGAALERAGRTLRTTRSAHTPSGTRGGIAGVFVSCLRHKRRAGRVAPARARGQPELAARILALALALALLLLLADLSGTRLGELLGRVAVNAVRVRDKGGVALPPARGAKRPGVFRPRSALSRALVPSQSESIHSFRFLQAASAER